MWCKGTFLATGESSTIEFDLNSVSSSYTFFKLYNSTDGVTYTEDKDLRRNYRTNYIHKLSPRQYDKWNQNVAGIKDFQIQ